MKYGDMNVVKIEEYRGADLSKELRLQLYYYGNAKLDNSWQGRVVCSVVSRLYFVKTGSFFLTINGKKEELTEGNWYLIPCGSSYQYGCDSETEQYFFHFNLTGTDKTDVFGRCPALLSFGGKTKDADEIVGHLGNEDDLSVFFIKNTVMRILLKIMKEQNIDIGGNRYSDCVIKAINYIDKNLSESLTIKSVSEAIFVSQSTLSKHMRQELGTSVNRYIDDLILNRAARMIVEDVLTISAISNQFGFCDQFYFSRKFKAKFGVTPSAYRKLRDI